MIKYVHGSDDSRDKDVIYIFDEIPTISEVDIFIKNKKNNGEDANVAVIKNGIVEWVKYGRPDDVNNGLFLTYDLHEQEYPLLVDRLVEIDMILYNISVLRYLLSNFTRTKYRVEIKSALRGGFSDKLSAIKKMNFEDLPNLEFTKDIDIVKVLKSISFKTAKVVLEKDGFKLYTKKDICEKYPFLCNFIYMKPYTENELQKLNELIQRFINQLDEYVVEELDNAITYFVNENRYIDSKYEKVKRDVNLNE